MRLSWNMRELLAYYAAASSGRRLFDAPHLKRPARAKRALERHGLVLFNLDFGKYELTRLGEAALEANGYTFDGRKKVTR